MVHKKQRGSECRKVRALTNTMQSALEAGDKNSKSKVSVAVNRLNVRCLSVKFATKEGPGDLCASLSCCSISLISLCKQRLGVFIVFLAIVCVSMFWVLAFVCLSFTRLSRFFPTE